MSACSTTRTSRSPTPTASSTSRPCRPGRTRLRRGMRSSAPSSRRSRSARRRRRTSPSPSRRRRKRPRPAINSSAGRAVRPVLLFHASGVDMLHRFATFVAGCTVLLVLAGSLVTSTGSGLAVPYWPTTYGWNLFTFPPSKWVGGIFYEHGHRLIASGVGFLTIILAAWLWLEESRRWLAWIGLAALATVVAQGVLGGLTVIFFLPAAVSTAHAGLAEIFFCLTIAIALFTSAGWIDGYGVPDSDDLTLRRLTTTTTVLIYAQILV